MRTTILLLSVDEAEWLKHSLPAAVAQPGADVVVIDNASLDNTRQVAREHGARVILLPTRVSYAAAMNQGIRETDPRGDDAVLLLNADCILDPGFLDEALPPLFSHRRVGSVAPKLMRLAGPTERLNLIDTAGLVVDRRRKNNLVGHGSLFTTYTRAGAVFGADGAAALYRRETLRDCAEDARVLDEEMRLWASDVDLAWRAQLLGWTCLYEPGAIAYHQRTYSPSTRRKLSREARTLQFRNRYLMRIKNDITTQRLPWLPWIALYEVLALGHVLVREPFLLRGYRDAFRLRPVMRAKRKALQARRRVDRVPLGLRPKA